MDGNVTLGRLHYRRAVCFLQTQHLVLHTLSSTCVLCFIFCLSNRGKNIFEYSLVADIISTLFYSQDHTWHQNCKKMISEGQSHAQNYILPMSNVLEVDTTVSNICHLSHAIKMTYGHHPTAFPSCNASIYMTSTEAPNITQRINILSKFSSIQKPDQSNQQHHNDVNIFHLCLYPPNILFHWFVNNQLCAIFSSTLFLWPTKHIISEMCHSGHIPCQSLPS